jgi:hypothetical protein
MKRLVILLATVFYCTGVFAQTDSTAQVKKSDTIRIGNIIIVKKGDKKSSGNDSGVVVAKAPHKKSRISTNWGIVDLGFANYDDKSNYAAANADGYLVARPGYPDLNKDNFKLRTGKSVNVNIWFFMQRLNLVKENVSLKYGLGLELNNYRYKSEISYKENGVIPYTNDMHSDKPFIFRDSITFDKNKLAADFFTIPVMLNFSTNDWGKYNGFNIAIGVSGGYLYSMRNKQISESRGKEKNRGDYDLERFKFSYIGEIGIGPVKFYASYSPHSLYEHSLDMRPYNFGIRLSHE